MPTPFLTARWQDLALVTYDLDPALVRRHLPADCEPDLVDGAARASLVAFDFLDARVFGRRWPGHVNFPEVNLRFYVTRGGVRGVSFLSEFVTKRAISVIARLIYNEPYTAVPMRTTPTWGPDTLTIHHELKVHGRWQSIRVTGRRPAVDGDASADWIKEHHWGFGQTRGGRPLSYEVTHDRWKIYPDAKADLDFDFAHVYGPDFAGLNRATPVSTILAVGSTVTVSPKHLESHS